MTTLVDPQTATPKVAIVVPKRDVPMRALAPFFAIAFGIGWGVIATFMLFTSQIEALFGPVTGTHPLFILAVYSPGIASLLLVWRYTGIRGLGRFLRRLTLWRMPLAWWVFLLVGIRP